MGGPGPPPPRRFGASGARRAALLLGLAALLLAAMIGSICLGKYPIHPGEIAATLYQAATGQQPAAGRLRVLHDLILEVRLPRVLAACLVGAALSVAGAAYQAMFVNPLVSPSLLGVLAGASFGAAAGILGLHSWPAVQAATCAGGFLAVGLTMAIASSFRERSTLLLVLGGVAVTTFFNALVYLLKYLADPGNQLPAIVHWLMGNLALADRISVLRAAGPIAVGVGVLVLLGRQLDALSMGDEEARSLGVDARRIRVVVIVAATLVSTLTVALAGVVAWVGLVVPHLARLAIGPDNRTLLPACALVGATYLLLVDDLSRSLFTFELPIGIATALVGIPFFLVVLRNARQGWR